jgi:hypothetical protein
MRLDVWDPAVLRGRRNEICTTVHSGISNVRILRGNERTVSVCFRTSSRFHVSCCAIQQVPTEANRGDDLTQPIYVSVESKGGRYCSATSVKRMPRERHLPCPSKNASDTGSLLPLRDAGIGAEDNDVRGLNRDRIGSVRDPSGDACTTELQARVGIIGAPRVAAGKLRFFWLRL